MAAIFFSFCRVESRVRGKPTRRARRWRAELQWSRGRKRRKTYLRGGWRYRDSRNERDKAKSVGRIVVKWNGARKGVELRIDDIEVLSSAMRRKLIFLFNSR